MSVRNANIDPNQIKLFNGEKLLVITGLIGFFLSAGCAYYKAQYGAIILPEGNVGNAFSFNAAIALFAISIAAFLPLSGLKERSRTRLRWGFILTILIGYGIENIQHFRGVNPRFTQAGSIADTIVGGFFGLSSLVLGAVTILLAVSFFSRKKPMVRPLLNLGMRYAFVSLIIAFLSGMAMIALQSRYIGSAGNFIVVHGFAFHALQALPLIGWLLERYMGDEDRARRLIHIGGIAWMVSVISIGVQTILGGTTFELSVLPILAAVALLGWATTVVISSRKLLF